MITFLIYQLGERPFIGFVTSLSIALLGIIPPESTVTLITNIFQITACCISITVGVLTIYAFLKNKKNSKKKKK